MRLESDENRKKYLELKEAAKPLVDFLYKYYDPHTTVLVTQSHTEVCEGYLVVPNDLRD